MVQELDVPSPIDLGKESSTMQRSWERGWNTGSYKCEHSFFSLQACSARYKFGYDKQGCAIDQHPQPLRSLRKDDVAKLTPKIAAPI
jgi:hypothetical protein